MISAPAISSKARKKGFALTRFVEEQLRGGAEGGFFPSGGGWGRGRMGMELPICSDFPDGKASHRSRLYRDCRHGRFAIESRRLTLNE